MFEQPAGNVEKDRSRIIVILSSAAVAVVVGLIILVGSRSVIQPSQVELSRKGSEEYDSYIEFVQITNLNRSTAERLSNKIGIIRCRVQNTGEKVLTGLQLRGVAIGFDGEVLKETVITPIPKVRDTLAPNQFIPIELYLEPIPDPATVMEMAIEVSGLKVK
ncbi:MAG TPA: hypothetical protein VLD57_03545 [Blastocatellia bacterium]|nr:hypothetical protein [Blastocatellia bacterium]